MKPVQSFWLTLAAPFLFGQQANAQSVEQLNGTTVQVNLPEGQRMYLDFYGPSIIRVFQVP